MKSPIFDFAEIDRRVGGPHTRQQSTNDFGCFSAYVFRLSSKRPSVSGSFLSMLWHMQNPSSIYLHRKFRKSFQIDAKTSAIAFGAETAILPEELTNLAYREIERH